MLPAKTHCPISALDSLCNWTENHLIKQCILTFCCKHLAKLWFMRFNKLWLSPRLMVYMILGPVQAKNLLFSSRQMYWPLCCSSIQCTVVNILGLFLGGSRLYSDGKTVMENALVDVWFRGRKRRHFWPWGNRWVEISSKRDHSLLKDKPHSPCRCHTIGVKN